MDPLIYELRMFLTVALLLMTTVIVAIGVLSMLRRRQFVQADVSLAMVQSVSSTEVEVPGPLPLWEPPHVETQALSDHVVIYIEPDEGPTREQQAVQRLIEHLKSA